MTGGTHTGCNRRMYVLAGGKLFLVMAVEAELWRRGNKEFFIIRLVWIVTGGTHTRLNGRMVYPPQNLLLVMTVETEVWRFREEESFLIL